MKQKLSVASRILVAFASGALIAVFFLPAWRIDLFAPQYPDVGGWIVIGAAMLAFGVWFVEWYRHRKTNRSMKINTASAVVTAVAISLLFTACAARTEPFQYGKDNCHFCKMGIIDPKFGGEIVTKKSKVYKFDDVICMVQFLKTDELKEKDIAHKVIINFEKQNDFLDVQKATFWVSPALRSPMGSNAAAFSSRLAAEKAKGNTEGQLLTWDELYRKIK